MKISTIVILVVLVIVITYLFFSIEGDTKDDSVADSEFLKFQELKVRENFDHYWGERTSAPPHPYPSIEIMLILCYLDTGLLMGSNISDRHSLEEKIGMLRQDGTKGSEKLEKTVKGYLEAMQRRLDAADGKIRETEEYKQFLK